MATLDPVRFGDIALQIGNGATPSETFATLCGFTSITKSYNINTQTEDLPECDGDPDAVSFEGAVKVSVGETIQFQGYVDVDASDELDRLAYEDEPVNIRHVYNKGAKVGYYEGPAILTAGEEAYERRQAGRMSGSFKWTARPTWVAT